MTVVASYLYRDGHRVREVSIDEKVDCADNKSEFVWIGIADPTEEEMHKLAAWAAILAVPTAMPASTA